MASTSSKSCKFWCTLLNSPAQSASFVSDKPLMHYLIYISGAMRPCSFFVVITLTKRSSHVHCQSADTNFAKRVESESGPPILKAGMLARTMRNWIASCGNMDGATVLVSPQFPHSYILYLVYIYRMFPSIGCRIPVQKESGCNHMTVGQYLFMWELHLTPLLISVCGMLHAFLL